MQKAVAMCDRRKGLKMKKLRNVKCENPACSIRLKFNSSNIQGKLKEGHTYKVTVIGYRVPFFSWYQNIIKVEELE